MTAKLGTQQSDLSAIQGAARQSFYVYAVQPYRTNQANDFRDDLDRNPFYRNDRINSVVFVDQDFDRHAYLPLIP